MLHRSPVARPRRRTPVLLLLVAAAGTLGLAACSQPSDEHLVEAMVTSGIDRSVAICAMEAIDDLLTSEERDWLVERGYGGAPRDDLSVDDDLMDRLRNAMSTCRDGATTTVPAGDTGN